MRKNTRHRTRKKHTRRTKTKSSHSKRRKQGNKYGGKDLRVVQASNRWVIHRKISPHHGKGQRGGKWTRHHVIGTGTYGSVHECSKVGEDGQRYAMKVFEFRSKTSTEIYTMKLQIQDEIDFTKDIHKLATDPKSKYKHLDVKAVEIIESNLALVDQEQGFYVQTLITGCNMLEYLKHLLQSGEHVEETFVKQAFLDIANYIYMCNTNKIYHNDIKIENVMVDKSKPPRAYVIDLGLATKTVTKNGTRYYIPLDNTYPRDIWAFGILVSEMLLEKLFKNTPTDDILEDWRLQITNSVNISPTLKILLGDILHNDPTSRLTDPTAFKERIDTWYTHVAPEPEPEPEPDEYEEDPRFPHAQQDGTETGTCRGPSCLRRFFGLGSGYAQKKRTRRKRTRRKRTRRKRTRRTQRTRRKRTQRTQRR